MIIRIVRMSFDPQKQNEFINLFNDVKSKIRNFDGCKYLQLNTDINQPNVMYTLSHWHTEQHLEAYRNSDLFKSTWLQTKTFFNDKPQAFSITNHTELL